jgi:hypothetical protein
MSSGKTAGNTPAQIGFSGDRGSDVFFLAKGISHHIKSPYDTEAK